MLAFSAVRLAERQGLPRDQETNVLLESFVVHVRCLRDFVWGARNPRHPMDALASDYCETGKWERMRDPLPTVLTEIDARRRPGREVVHLSYDRLDIEAASKDWNVGTIYAEFADALELLAKIAVDSRMDNETRRALTALAAHDANVGPASVATGAVYGLAIQGGTVAFPGFQAGS